MNESDLIKQGLNLVMLGMGFVFVFLTLLVVVTALMSKIVSVYEKRVGILPEEGIPAPTAVITRNAPDGSVSQSSAKSDDNATLISVLSSAIHKYRSRHK